ncbi:hypothetical protein BPJM79_70116 [Bacillus pumilus]
MFLFLDILLCFDLINHIDPTKKDIPINFKINLVRNVDPSVSIPNKIAAIMIPTNPAK